MNTRVHFTILAITSSLLAAGCGKLSESEPYKLISTPAGDIYRLQTATGALHMVAGISLIRVPEVDRIQLQVGSAYFLENGNTMKYVGEGKFEPFKSDVVTLDEYLKSQAAKK